MPSLMPSGKQQYTNNAGVPLAGGRVYTYAVGTTEPKATYQDAAATVQNANPIVLNARGEALAFWEGAYTVKVTDANGLLIYTVDNYQAPLMAEDLLTDDGGEKVKGTWFNGIKAKLSELGSQIGASLIGFLQGGLGAVPRSLQDKLREHVSVTDFGAKCDGVTSDRAAVQRAIDYCAANGWPRLEVPGKCYIDAPLIIDREVDTTTSEFFIVGTGAGAGFHTDKPINIFSSSYAIASHPLSEFVVFQNVRFSASSKQLAAFAVDGDAFLRMRWSQCYFYRIRCAKTKNYLQSYYFDNCNMRHVLGILLHAVNTPGQGALSGAAFDIHWTDNIFEKGSLGEGPTGFLLAERQTAGCSFKGGNFEGCAGPFYETANTYGAFFGGMYFEENGDIEIKLGISWACSIIGNKFEQHADRYNIHCGASYNVHGAGNWTNKNLYLDTGMAREEWATGLVSDGDYAAVQLMASLPKGLSGTMALTLSGFAEALPVNARYTKIGRTVTLSLPAAYAASSGPTLFLGGIPAALLPIGRVEHVVAPVIDGGVYGTGVASVTSDGITFGKTLVGPAGPVFASAGVKGIADTTLTYQI